MTQTPSDPTGAPEGAMIPPGAVARRRRAAARERRMLKRAAPLFLERGYDTVSINDIMRAVGGSKTTLYAAFGSKEGLFLAVVRALCDEVTVALDTRAEGPLEERLARLGRSFLIRVTTPEALDLYRLMIGISRSFPDAAQLFHDVGPGAAYRTVADWIAARQAEGAMQAGPAEDLAALYLDMLTGRLQSDMLTSTAPPPRAEDIDRLVQLATRIFLQGIEAGRPGVEGAA